MTPMELLGSPSWQRSSECSNTGETQNSLAQRDRDLTSMKLQGSFHALVPVAFAPCFQIQPVTPPTGIHPAGTFPTTLPLP